MARKAKIKIQKLTILLLKRYVRSCKSALRGHSKLTSIKLKEDAGFNGQFWFAKPDSRIPGWFSFIGEALEQPPIDIKSSAVSAVLFVKAAKRLFAITFGHGRNLLKPNCYELGFGLKVALNSIDHNQIRSLDIRAYEEFAMSTRKQASRSADLTPFGLDVSRDMLRAVTGEPSDQKFAKRVSGADAITINLPIRARELEKKCEQLLKKWQETTYRANFAWIDNLKEVRDQSLLNKLNDKLIEAIRNREIDKLHLAAPEPLDWQNIDCFRITGTRQREYLDLDIDEYLTQLGESAVFSLTIDDLKKRSVSLRYSTVMHFQDKWPLFSCIVWETNENDSLYVLVEGKWFQIESSYATNVKTFVSQISQYTALPPAHQGEKESNYNERVAKESSYGYYCLDKQLFKPKDAANKIEFCDLISKSQQLVHIKRKSRSSTLSHLFSQGTVGARMFLVDNCLRDEVRAKLPEDYRSMMPDGSTRPNPSEWEVVYAVITKGGMQADALPFFSQLNLMQHTKLLQELGFKVAFAAVEDQA